MKREVSTWPREKKKRLLTLGKQNISHRAVDHTLAWLNKYGASFRILKFSCCSCERVLHSKCTAGECVADIITSAGIDERKNIQIVKYLPGAIS